MSNKWKENNFSNFFWTVANFSFVFKTVQLKLYLICFWFVYCSIYRIESLTQFRPNRLFNCYLLTKIIQLNFVRFSTTMQLHTRKMLRENNNLNNNRELGNFDWSSKIQKMKSHQYFVQLCTNFCVCVLFGWKITFLLTNFEKCMRGISIAKSVFAVFSCFFSLRHSKTKNYS